MSMITVSSGPTGLPSTGASSATVARSASSSRSTSSSGTSGSYAPTSSVVQSVSSSTSVCTRPLQQRGYSLALHLRLFILTRHAHSTLNAEGRVNGDPAVPVHLTEDGRAEAARLGHQLSELRIDLCVHTRFAR